MNPDRLKLCEKVDYLTEQIHQANLMFRQTDPDADKYYSLCFEVYKNTLGVIEEIMNDEEMMRDTEAKSTLESLSHIKDIFLQKLEKLQ